MSKTSRDLIQDYLEHRTNLIESWAAEQRRAEKSSSDALLSTNTITMPAHPKEETNQAEGNITDQVAKGSSESTASSHPAHHTGDQTKATYEDHQNNPGPAISSSNFGEPASKEELKKRAEELNKK